MTFEGAYILPELPQEDKIEAPLSSEREILALSNSIQIELIASMIPPGKDIDEYPMEWIEKYAKEFHEIFIEELKVNQHLMEDWQDENKREDVRALFQRKLAMKIVK